MGLIERHPGKPWLWRDDWAQGYSRPEAISQAKTWIAAGALLLLLSVPIAMQFREEWINRGNYLALLALVFPIVGLWMVGKAAASWLRHRKFANLRLVLSGVPATLGGRLAGRIEGDFRLPPGTNVTLVLSCVRSYVSRSGTDRARWQRVLWQDKRTATAYTGGPAITVIPVEFEIPCDAPQTDSRNPDDVILWRLATTQALPGLDFRCEFLAPVFKTEAGDPLQTIAALDARSQARSIAPAGPVRFHLPAARHKGIATAVTLFGAVSLGSGLFFGYGLSQLSWLVGLIPLVIIGGLGLLLLAIAFSLWFRATTVEVIDGDLRIRSTYLLLFSSSRTLRKEAIKSFELHCGMQRGDEVWYDLRAHLANGRRRTICGGMEKSEAEGFLAGIERDMGI